jgi:hypothetical protein
LIFLDPPKYGTGTSRWNNKVLLCSPVFPKLLARFFFSHSFLPSPFPYQQQPILLPNSVMSVFEHFSIGADNERGAKAMNKVGKKLKAGCFFLFVVSVAIIVGSVGTATFRYIAVESPTPPLAENAKVISFTSTIIAEFESNDSDDKLCAYSGSALCNQMSTSLGSLGGLRACVTESCDVTDAPNNRRLALGLETINKSIVLAQSLTVVSFDEEAKEPPQISSDDIVGVVQVADMTWFVPQLNPLPLCPRPRI